jgi:hypothetical protein
VSNPSRRSCNTKDEIARTSAFSGGVGRVAILLPLPNPGVDVSTTSRHFSCTPADVFAVLGDGWLNGLWVVGASRIRDVDESWPAPGTEIHHSFGVWPLLIDDTTSVEASEPDRHLRLRARGWPAGEADVDIEIRPTPGGCTVTITEDAVKGPGLLVPRPVRSAVLGWRNRETLRRLAFLATNRAAKQRHGGSLEPGTVTVNNENGGLT